MDDGGFFSSTGWTASIESTGLIAVTSSGPTEIDSRLQSRAELANVRWRKILLGDNESWRQAMPIAQSHANRAHLRCFGASTCNKYGNKLQMIESQ